MRARRGCGRTCGAALRALALAVACVATAACAPAPTGAAAAPVPASATEGLAAARLGRGWVVWETNRDGPWRIWIRPLDGGSARRLSPEEPGRDHCCAHLSPDGQRVVYLSLPGGARKYLPPDTVGVLHLIETDGRRDHVVAARARHYGEHRAALWWRDDAFAFVDGRGDTRLLDLGTATTSLLVRGPERGEGFLVDPTGRWATSSTPTFSARDPATGDVRLATPLGGCQAWLGAEGRFGVWTAGAGGPIDAIDLATRRTWTILAKHDPRLPRDRGYLYFPMLSRDRSLLAVAASDDGHDHFRADYDVFLVELDPATLEPRGRAVRVTSDPAVDRYPDVWRQPGARRPPAPSAVAGTRAGTPPPAAGPDVWPADPRGLAFLWESADRPNRRAPDADSELLEARGEAWTDRRGRLALAGGWFAAAPESAQRVAAELKGSNTVTVELVAQPAAIGPGPEAALLALGDGPRRRGLLVSLRGSEVLLRIRTGATGPAGGSPARLAALPDAGAHHLAFSYSPGRLRTYLDGAPVAAPPWAADFWPWRIHSLDFGAEPGGEGSFRGWLSHLAIYARELTPEEIASDARRALADLAATPQLAPRVVDAELLTRSRVPGLEEISPYRRALVVEQWRPLDVAPDAGAPLRVARWALLDGRDTAAMSWKPGTRARLELQPFAQQPQLESVYLSDTLPPAPAARLWFDVALVPER
jgi:hypothetical protein